MLSLARLAILAAGLHWHSTYALPVADAEPEDPSFQFSGPLGTLSGSTSGFEYVPPDLGIPNILGDLSATGILGSGSIGGSGVSYSFPTGSLFSNDEEEAVATVTTVLVGGTPTPTMTTVYVLATAA